MSSAPSISVVIPAHNAAAWIEETLASVLSQTSPAQEIIVVDDGSTDDTAALAERHGDRLTLLRQSNEGCGMAFNRAIAHATGDYVALCPADDIWMARKLEWQRETLARMPQIDVSFGAGVAFGSEQGSLPAPRRHGLQDARGLMSEMYIRDVILAPSVVLRRSLHQRHGGFVAAPGEDYEFWMRVLRDDAVFHFDPRVLVRHRRHASNLSSQALPMWQMVLHVHRTFAADIGDERLARDLIARDLRTLGRCHLGLDQPRAARRAYRESWGVRPSLTAIAGSILPALPGAARALRWLNDRRRRGGYAVAGSSTASSARPARSTKASTE